MNVIYEITATVRPDLTADYESYMRNRHVPDLLATGFFVSVRFSRSGNRFRVCYESNDLDGYLSREAARLRADFVEHFPEGVELSRENWDVIESWPKSSER